MACIINKHTEWSHLFFEETGLIFTTSEILDKPEDLQRKIQMLVLSKHETHQRKETDQSESK